MSQINLRPEFRTAGGEVNDLELDGIYAGTITLIYREKDRLIGSIQLDKSMLTQQEKIRVVDWANNYVHSLAEALNVEECEVIVTYAKIDHIITSLDEGVDESIDYELDELDEDDEEEDDEEEEEDDDDGLQKKPIRLELVIVGEDDDRIEYHIYGKQKEWLAEAIFVIEETEVFGDVNWMVKPSEDEIVAATELIVSDFDEEEIDNFEIEMKYQGVTLESIELTHEDMLELDDQWSNKETWDTVESIDGVYSDSEDYEYDSNGRQYSAKLIRDDADALTYDIYEQSSKVGRATIDTSHRRLTGFIELLEPTRSKDREILAIALHRELEKDKEYESLNVTMLHNNKRIEDIFFENDSTH